jgi:hypothetical protein
MSTLGERDDVRMRVWAADPTLEAASASGQDA